MLHQFAGLVPFVLLFIDARFFFRSSNLYYRMKVILRKSPGQPVKKKYQKPRLQIHGSVAKITLKGGSAMDSDMTNTFQG